MARPCLALVATLALIAAGTSLFAAPPQAGEISRYKRDGSFSERLEFQKSLGNHRYAPELVERAKAKIQRAALEARGVPKATIESVVFAPPGNPGMPSTGTVKIPCVLIEFSDMGPSAINTQPYIHNSLFGQGVASQFPYESLSAFYSRSSFGKLKLEGSTLGWYRTAYPRSQVQMTTAGRQNLIKEALTSFNASHDFSQYDNDNDGDIDYLLVVYAGVNNGWGNFWWAYQTSWWNDNFTIDGKRLGTYVFQYTNQQDHTAPFAPRTVIHETGHALGLPDLYDYDETVGPDGGVGGLDVMGGHRGDHNGFHKWLLEWSTPQVVGHGTVDRTFRPAATSGDGAVVMKGASMSDRFDEFFFVENRSAAGNDAQSSWPFSGLLIWHVDSTLDAGGNDFAFDNSLTPHKLLRVMEADGLEQIEQNLGGDSGDFWKPLQSFHHASRPSSARYDGAPSDVAVTNIRSLPSSMAAVIGTENFVIVNRPPTLAPLSPVVLECVNGAHTIDLSTVVSDADGQPLTVTWKVDGPVAKTQTGVAPGSVASLTFAYGHGVHTVEAIVIDGAAQASVSTTVTVQDTKAPIVVVAANRKVPCDPGKAFATNVALAPPTATDVSGHPVTLKSDARSTYPLGETIVTWTATDESGNKATATQKVTVVDLEKPKITPLAAINRFCDPGQLFATAKLIPPKATDNVPKPVSVKTSLPVGVGVRFKIGTTNVVWTAKDAAGNVSTWTQKVVVTNRRPTARAGKDLVIVTTSAKGTRVNLNGSASSDPDKHQLKFKWSVPGVKLTGATTAKAYGVFPVGTKTATLTVTDGGGLKHTDTVKVTVRLKNARPRALGGAANRSFAAAAVQSSAAPSSFSSATMLGRTYAATAAGLGDAAGDHVQWEEGGSPKEAALAYSELRALQRTYGSAAVRSLLSAFAETGDKALLSAARHAADGTAFAEADLAE